MALFRVDYTGRGELSDRVSGPRPLLHVTSADNEPFTAISAFTPPR